uniref:Uncharacterized protein n=1 Tax=Lepeophtheirus salmonis TaxID=72036 RepID=A0A0K2T9P3_LEPSM
MNFTISLQYIMYINTMIDEVVDTSNYV